ncbi:MAG: putative ubiquinone biosynthesis monooxygenase, partial [Paramarteilia canceri]
MVAIVQHLKPVNETFFWQKFLPDGPFAVLPIDNSKSYIFWTMAHKSSEAMKNLDKEDLINKMNDAIL